MVSLECSSFFPLHGSISDSEAFFFFFVCSNLLATQDLQFETLEENRTVGEVYFTAYSVFSFIFIYIDASMFMKHLQGAE